MSLLFFKIDEFNDLAIEVLRKKTPCKYGLGACGRCVPSYPDEQCHTCMQQRKENTNKSEAVQ